jgi:hypothetical membrane protein
VRRIKAQLDRQSKRAERLHALDEVWHAVDPKAVRADDESSADVERGGDDPLNDYRLLFGPLAGALLLVGIAGLALMIPGYSHVHQTVSEIGETGSPAQIQFALLLCAVAICILVFAVAVRAASIESAHSPLCAYFIGAMTLSVAGVGLFAFPHPLHNVFGLSETVGYQAPLVMALTWRGEKRASSLATVSWVAFGLIWLAIALNLSAMDRHGELWAYVKPCYGLVQRALFAAWFGWLAVVGFLLFRRKIVPHHA